MRFMFNEKFVGPIDEAHESIPRRGVQTLEPELENQQDEGEVRRWRVDFAR